MAPARRCGRPSALRQLPPAGARARGCRRTKGREDAGEAKNKGDHNKLDERESGAPAGSAAGSESHGRRHTINGTALATARRLLPQYTSLLQREAP